ncbi:DeoR/GlpR family DNA-binding transcription regulator [Rhizobium sp. BR 314]|uniref:DeoR/GlpR family DNA-binding transcription regulator n=1 Tax=Rhizobium sp. BR 314 TaxID=3040013 RepID=UPI0039BED0AE
MSKLPAAGRHQNIVSLVNGGHGMSIAAMAEAFGVSTETVRRDLVALERNGALRRVYGGAIPSDRKAPLEERVLMERAGKQAIGRRVASLIEADQWIFMTGGSSVLAVAEAMRDGPTVSVMTNMPAIGEALQAGQRHRVHFTGGEYNASAKMLMGDEVFDAIENCSFDLSIVGVYGLDERFGLVEETRHNMRLKLQIVSQSRDAIYVADHTKIGAPGRYQSIPFKDIGTFVTDEQLAPHFTALLAEAGTNVLYPDTAVNSLPAAEAHDHE